MSNQQPYGGRQPPYQGPPQQWGAPQYQGPPPQQPQYGPQYGAPQYNGPAQYYGPPPGAPGFGWGPGGPQQPKKKSKAWLAIIPVLVVGVVGLWIYGVIQKQHRLNDYAQPQPTASYTPSDDPSTGPSTKPTEAQTTGTDPKPTKATPPPPRTPTPYEVVSRTKFYRTGVQASVRCRESGARPTSLSNAIRYYANVKSCADRGWPRQVNAAGLPFKAPNTIVMNGKVGSPCGYSAPSSYYCAINHTMYLAGDYDMAQYRRANGNPAGVAFVRANMLFVVAHEYGHHIQQITGILPAFNRLWYDAPNKTAQLEVQRRMELQASCFGGLFVAANRNSYPISGQLKTQFSWMVYHMGDNYDPIPGHRIHGNRISHGNWTMRGYNTRNLAACNTFTATSAAVQ
ncbi:neutral zinc metallopeptidase [Kribbella voronezhensis]|uniref:neutral zinc metallopeptidase n=1 Tax=Kribbella voronezhensis TaxID=2512212 RepID=UPI0014170D34|nr:neutral zinc metallopeptidase [Kribbella voronezhensis]